MQAFVDYFNTVWVQIPLAVSGFAMSGIVLVMADWSHLGGKLLRGFAGATAAAFAVAIVPVGFGGTIFLSPPFQTIALVREYETSLPLPTKLEVRVEEIRTLSRKPHQTNLGIQNRRKLFQKVRARAEIWDSETAEQYIQMSQDEWERYLDELKPEKRARLLDIPFARFTVLEAGEPIWEDRNFFVANDGFKIKLTNGTTKRIRVLNIFDVENSTREKSTVIVALSD